MKDCCNDSVVNLVLYFLMAFGLCGYSCISQAQYEDRDPAAEFKEFQRELEIFKERQKDFFQHIQWVLSYENKIDSGIGDLKDQRQKQSLQENEFLVQYKKELSRKPQIYSKDMEDKEELRILEDRKKWSQLEKSYSDQRKKIEKTKREINKIPENQEAGLED
ncbi:MAG: hypothetical protein K1X29_03160 [Bdellovibrionales bacterium]|nr:hypothetical protein [Bdellovibrionales bacterium]